MEIVGHAALEMTMNVYGHVDLGDQRAALDRLNDLLGAPAGTNGEGKCQDVAVNDCCQSIFD
jgi:hypothetical protein